MDGAAVSPDLLLSGEACYGDALVIPGIGIRIVNDTTNKRLKNTVDIFVDTKEQEHRIGVRHLKVSVLKSEKRACSRKVFMSMKKP